MRVVVAKRHTAIGVSLHPLEAIDGNLEVDTLFRLDKVGVVEEHGRVITREVCI